MSEAVYDQISRFFDDVDKGFDDSHFDAVAGHPQSTLQQLNVPSNLIDQVMTVAAGTRDDVLNR